MTAGGMLRPAELQHLLLVAGLCPDRERALTARIEWERRVDLDKLDLGSLQLLTLLDDGGDRAGAITHQLKNITRFSWVKSQLLMRAATPVIEQMEQAGLEPVLSKGAAVVHAHGVPARLRPMFDIDIWVAPERLPDAARLLAGLGFSSPVDDALRSDPARLAGSLHAAPFADRSGAAIDLHWHLLHSGRSTALGSLIAADTVAAAYGRVGCRATGLEDTLLISIAHGSRWARGAAVRWAGDVALLLGLHGDQVDWDRLCLRARQMRIGAAVADALEYVQEVASVGPSRQVVARLRRAPQPLAVRMRRRRRALPGDGGPAAPGAVASLVEAYEEDVAQHAEPGTRTGPADAARFLARRWGLRSARRVPAHALWVAAGRPLWQRRLAHTGLTADMRGWLPALPHYELGDELFFDGDGEGFWRLGPGWWYPESHGIWARTHCAWVLLPLARQPPVDRLSLEVDLIASIAPRRPRQRADVVFCDHACASVELDADAHTRAVVADVPAIALGREVVAIIAIRSDPVMTPADSRLNSDLRQIGVGITRLRLAAA